MEVGTGFVKTPRLEAASFSIPNEILSRRRPSSLISLPATGSDSDISPLVSIVMLPPDLGYGLMECDTRLGRNCGRIREDRYAFAEGAWGGLHPVLRSINTALRLAAAHATEAGS